jgi:hypothetical protein
MGICAKKILKSPSDYEYNMTPSQEMQPLGSKKIGRAGWGDSN